MTPLRPWFTHLSQANCIIAAACFLDCHKYKIEKLQRVQNAAARLICKQPKFSHIKPVLYELHWLPIKYRIKFKILLITFKVLTLSPLLAGFLANQKRVCINSMRRFSGETEQAWTGNLKQRKTGH